MQMRMADMFRIPRLYQNPKYIVRRGTNQQAGMLRINNTIFRSKHRRAVIIDFTRHFQKKGRYNFKRSIIIENY